MDLDLQQIDRANEGIDRLIESRAAAGEPHEALQQAESLQRYSLRGAAENRRAWCAYYRPRVALYEDLARESREKLVQLLDGAGDSSAGRA